MVMDVYVYIRVVVPITIPITLANAQCVSAVSAISYSLLIFHTP